MFSFLSKKFDGLLDIIKGIKTLDESSLEILFKGIKSSFIDADVPVDTINDFLESIKSKALDVKVSKKLEPKEYLAKLIYDELIFILGGKNQVSKHDFLGSVIAKNKNDLTIIMMAGLQGAGKTTTISKLIKRIISHPKTNHIKHTDIAAVSVDFYRPAAREQLRILSNNLGVEYYSLHENDPKSEALESIKKAKQDKKKVLFIDTAGRTVVDETMMNELKELSISIQPHATLLVIDIMSGQKGLEIAHAFVDAIKINGIVLSKVDSEAPGGIVLGLSKKLDIPIVYSAYGEKPSDIESFDSVRAAERLLGMGDLLALSEKAEQKISKSEEDLIKNAIQKGDLTILEFVKVIEMLESLGSTKQVMGMIPKHLMGNMNVSDDQINQIETDNKKFKTLSNSMTLQERKTPDLLLENNSRIIRIAKGSGIKKEETIRLLEKYKQMRAAMKPMRAMMKFF
jgi:signal recognition particle subunit SRP54